MADQPRISDVRGGRAGDMPPGDDDAPELPAVERLRADVTRLLEMAGHLVAAHPGSSAAVGQSVEQLERLGSKLDDRLEDLRSRHPGWPRVE